MAWGALNPIGGTSATSPYSLITQSSAIPSVMMLAALQAIQYSTDCALAGDHGSNLPLLKFLSGVLC